MATDWYQLALSIFHDWEINQSVTIKGFVQTGEDEPVPAGQLICEYLEKFDKEANTFAPSGDKKIRRKRYKPPNTIGGYVAHKMFKWKQEIRDHKMVYTIWRIQ